MDNRSSKRFYERLVGTVKRATLTYEEPRNIISEIDVLMFIGARQKKIWEGRPAIARKFFDFARKDKLIITTVFP